MMTPAGNKDNSKRMSRLGGSSFSNPFKRRGSNAAVFATPSASSLVCQQLADIGFPETEVVIEEPLSQVKPPLWPPRRPMLRSTTCSDISQSTSRMPDSPTGNRRHATDSCTRNPSNNRASRIPTPTSRNASRSSPTKPAPVASQETSINPRKTRGPTYPPSVVRKPVTTQDHDESAKPIDIAPILQRQNPTRAVTISNVPSSHRNSSYDVVLHQLMKPKDALPDQAATLPIASALSSSATRRNSAFIASTKTENQQASPRDSVSESVTSSPVKRHSTRGRASSCLKDDCPPSLPPIHASPPFDPSLALRSNDGAGNENGDSAHEKVTNRKSLDAKMENVPAQEEPPIHHVFDDQPNTYWTGRFVSVHDHYMAEARDLPDPRDADDEDKMLMLELKRARHIFAVLYGYCKTPIAEASLKVRLLDRPNVIGQR